AGGALSGTDPLRGDETGEEPRLQADRVRHPEREPDDERPPAHTVLRLAVGRTGLRGGGNLGRVLAHHLAHAAATGHVPLRDAAAVADGSRVERVRDAVRAVDGDAVGDLRTVAADEVRGQVVGEVHA